MCQDNKTESYNQRLERELKEQREQYQKELSESNKCLKAPIGLSKEEKLAWEEIAKLLISSTSYIKTTADAELMRQYVQTKILRDRAWAEYIKNPERYTRIVTGVCKDGETPKVLVKENEHYKTLTDCNKQLEKLLKELRLTPEARRKG
ncbi:MAG: P27 family phage terminase small subunit [Firmicutes bacterium]|nr:P27 family phage terminase small subunit [Bacillota bacterium]